jgi:hypothetical protein
MIDFKSEAEPTYAALKKVLKAYRSMLTEFTPDKTMGGPVTVVISGNRPLTTIQSEASRLAGIDGRLAELDGSINPNLMPWVSEKWGRPFKWSGEGPLSDSESENLEQIVARARKAGVKLRFWAIPDHQADWQVMHEAGVDLLNTDNLPGLQAFLLNAGNAWRPEAP